MIFPRSNCSRPAVHRPQRLRKTASRGMKFAVRACSCSSSGGNGRARAGVLHLGSCPHPIETPSLLLSTQKGLPAFITRDHLPALPSHLLHVSPLHFWDCPSPKTISKIGGLHQMVDLHEYGFVAAARDCITSLPVYESTNKFGASFDTPSGRRLVKPAQYVELVSSLKPDLWASLADEVPAWVSEKRNKTSVDRTLRWLDECISLDTADGKTLLGAIVGGSSSEERKRCALEVSRRNVSGYWIGGFGHGESMEERSALLDAVTVSHRSSSEGIKCFAGKVELVLKHYDKLSTFLGFVNEISLGANAAMKLFRTTYQRRNHAKFVGLDFRRRFYKGWLQALISLTLRAYIYHLTTGGYALTFPLNGDDTCAFDSQLSDIGSDSTKINLRATVYRQVNELRDMMRLLHKLQSVLNWPVRIKGEKLASVIYWTLLDLFCAVLCGEDLLSLSKASRHLLIFIQYLAGLGDGKVIL
ncbi:hypothetical protein ACLOJK_014213 [Asimina triloba]